MSDDPADQSAAGDTLVRSLQGFASTIQTLSGAFRTTLENHEAALRRALLEEMTQTRVAITEQIERLADGITGMRDDLAVTFGAADSVRRAHNNTREELRERIRAASQAGAARNAGARTQRRAVKGLLASAAMDLALLSAVPAVADPGPPNYDVQMQQALHTYCYQPTSNPITCQRREEESNRCLHRALNAIPTFNLAQQYLHSGTPPKDAAWMAAKVVRVPYSFAYAATQMPPSMSALEFANLIMQRCIEDIED